MAIYRKSGSSWISTKSIYRKVSSSWLQIKAVYRKAGSSWIKVFSGGGPTIVQQVTISQSTDSPTGIVTLIGRNYRWSNASSLRYEFKRSTNGGTSWPTISSGTATNPAVGSSNTETHELTLSNVSPNVDNMYIFEVTAVSSGNVTNTSESPNPEYVTGARNVTNLSIVSADTTFNSVKLQFDGGQYASSYLVRYRKGIIDGYHHAISSGSPATITVPNLDSNTTYSFYVTPYTGGLVSSLVTGYAGNESSPVSGSTSVMPQPVKVSSPTLSGTGVAFTSITAGSGTYQSGTFGGITTKIVYYLSPYTAPTDGEGSSSATIMDTATPAPTHPISQEDATTPNKKFYARDAVTAVNGTTTYYYYSPVVTARVGTVTDNFNRPAISSGLGTSSSGYIYIATANQATSSWSTDGSVAINSTTVSPFVNAITSSGTSRSGYPLQAIELSGKTDITASLELPDSGGGTGIAFWVSGAGSFWALAPSYDFTSTSNTTYTCDAAQPISVNDNSATTKATTCHNCDITTTTTTTTNTSSDCNFPVPKATDAQGTGCYGCAITTTYGSTSYSCGSGTTYNYSSSFIASMNCRGCSVSDTSYVSKTCTGGPADYYSNTLGTACGEKCSCAGPYVGVICAGGGSGATCPSLSAAINGRCGPCTFNPAISIYTWPINTNSTYYSCYTNVCTNVSQFSCTYSTATTSDTYTCRGQDTSTTSTTSTYKCSPKENTVVTSTYNTRLKILSTSTFTDGFQSEDFVLPRQSATINTNNSSFNKARKISVTTSGDNITGTAYSDLSGNIIGTVSIARNSGHPAKSSTNGSSYAGIIKTPSESNVGSQFDNLSIS